MKDKIELEIDEDGTIRTIHQEGIEDFADAMGGEISTSCRASNVEWEEFSTNPDDRGWTVRSAYDNELAARELLIAPHLKFGEGEIVCSRDRKLEIHCFRTREAAIEWELKHFWQLLEPRKDAVK